MSARLYPMLIKITLTLLIVACTVGQEPTNILYSQSDVRSDTDPDVATETVSELVASNNRFAFDLFHAVAQEEGNLFFSPFSIYTALAISYAGAQGETAEQMADGLHYTLSQAQLHPALHALTQHLTASYDDEKFELLLANALWGQEDEAFRQEYLELLAAHYSVRMSLVNFQSESGRRVASKWINQWVSDATAERVSNLVDPGHFTELTRFVLTNAITFDGLWEYPFDDTNNANFTLLDGTTVTVPMMRHHATTPYASGENWQAAKLIYAGEHAHMFILLPAEGYFEEFVRELDAVCLVEIEAALAPTDLVLYLPRFAYEADLTLTDTLTKMGITLAFSESEADFSGMVEIPPRLSISHVLHKAFVAVDELGTEAGAATALIAATGEENSTPEVMRVDRPFLFLIRDAELGTILFLGRMVDPAASR